MEILVIIWFIFRNDQWSESHSVMSNSLQPHGLYSPWNSPGQNAGVGSHSLLQGIFPTQESNWGLLHCRRILYQLSCQPGEFHRLCSPWDSKESDMTEWFHFQYRNDRWLTQSSRVVQCKYWSYSQATRFLVQKKKKFPVKEEFCSLNDSPKYHNKKSFMKMWPSPKFCDIMTKKDSMVRVTGMSSNFVSQLCHHKFYPWIYSTC